MTTNPLAPAKPVNKPAQKCLFQNESDWRPLMPEGSEDSDKAAAAQTSQMLKERLGSLLLTQNLLVLFGSGASVAVGGPSMPGLWHEAAVSQKAVFADVCKAVGHPEDKKDIEALLSRCQGAQAFVEKTMADKIKAFIEVIDGIIRDRCRKIESWEKLKGPCRQPLRSSHRTPRFCHESFRDDKTFHGLVFSLPITTCALNLSPRNAGCQSWMALT